MTLLIIFIVYMGGCAAPQLERRVAELERKVDRYHYESDYPVMPPVELRIGELEYRMNLCDWEGSCRPEGLENEVKKLNDKHKGHYH